MFNFEERLKNGEPLIYPKEVIYLGITSVVFILLAAISPIFFANSWYGLMNLVSFIPLGIIYKEAYRNAKVTEFAWEIKCLQLEPEEAKQAVDEFKANLK